MGKKIGLWLLVAILLLSGIPVLGEEEAKEAEAPEAMHLLAQAQVSSKPENKHLDRLSDGKISSYTEFPAGATLTLQVGSPLQGVYIQWKALPEKYTLQWLDEAGTASEKEVRTPFTVNEYIPVPEGVQGLMLTFPKKTGISEMELYGEGTLPCTLQQWEAPMENPAYMLLCGYPGDELLFFGGLLPLFSNNGIPVSVAYMSHYSRWRQEEGLQVLWDMGFTHYPVFLGIETGRNREAEYLKKNWGASAASLVEKMLLKYNPTCLLTFAEEGERLEEFVDETGKTRRMGEAQTAATGSAAVTGVTAARKKGWEGQLLYKAEEGTFTADLSQPLGLFKDTPATEVAQTLFDTYFVSLSSFGYTVEQNCAFMSNEEGAGGLLTEAASYTLLHEPVPTATPSPTPTPEPTNTPAPTEAPTQVPTMTPVPSLQEEENAEASTWGRPMWILLLGILVAVVLGGGLYLVKTFLWEELPVWLLVLIPLLIGFFCASLAGEALYTEELAVEATPAVTETPTPTCTPAPTDTPAPTNTPTPAPTEEPEESRFLEKGEAEQVTVDVENGYWSYRSHTLSIDIHRYTDDRPMVWFVADVYMQEADAFRPVFGNEGRTGRTPLLPWKIARLNKAVLFITGDNMVHMDVETKGAIIRDGRIYSNRNGSSAMGWDSETMTMEVFSARTYSAQDILAAGYENTYAFGPILVQNGEVDQKEIRKTSVYARNPRCGVGMVEPGHFVLIVVDGRRDEYSLGLDMQEFAQLFVDAGCVTAYNMDGGVSTCMIFMGEQLNSHGNITSYSKQRHMPDGFVIGYSENVPSITDPIYNDGIDEEYTKFLTP